MATNNTIGKDITLISSDFYRSSLSIKKDLLTEYPALFKNKEELNEKYESVDDINAKKNEKRHFTKMVPKIIKADGITLKTGEEEEKHFVVRKFVNLQKPFIEGIRRLIMYYVENCRDIGEHVEISQCEKPDSIYLKIREYSTDRPNVLITILYRYYDKDNEGVLNKFIADKIDKLKFKDNKISPYLEKYLANCLANYLLHLCIKVTVKKIKELKYNPNSEEITNMLLCEAPIENDVRIRTNYLKFIHDLQNELAQYEIDIKTNKKEVKSGNGGSANPIEE